MPSRVVVPLDGSPAAEAALPVALGLARALGAAVELVHVHDVPISATSARAGLLGVAEAAAAQRAEREATLGALAERLRQAAGGAAEAPSVHAVVLQGSDATDALLAHLAHLARAPVAPDAAAGPGAGGARTVVVLTTPARGLLARSVLGSVADRLAREADVPVVLVPPAADGAAAPGAGADPAPWMLRRALVPIDGSAVAREILERLTALPELHGVEVLLLQVLVPTGVGGLVPPTAMLDAEALDEEVDAARTTLDAAAGRLAERGFPARAEVVVAADVAGAIVERARTAGADLIAMASRGHGGLRRLALGSTADAVVRRAHRPVLLVHPRR